MLAGLKILLERERVQEGTLLNEYSLQRHYIMPDIDESMDDNSVLGKLKSCFQPMSKVSEQEQQESDSEIDT